MLGQEEGWRGRLGIESGRIRLVLILAAATVLLLLQSVVAQNPRLQFDIATLVVVYLALEHDLLGGLVMSILVGYMSDVFSGEPRGLYVEAAILVFLALRLFVFRITGTRFLLVTTLCLFSTILAVIVRLLTEMILGPGAATLDTTIASLPGTLIGAFLFGYPCHRLLRAIDERFKPAEEMMMFGGRSK